MDAFAGAWSSVDHVPMLTDACDEALAFSTTHQHPNSEDQDDEWSGFIKSIESGNSASGSLFDLPDFPLTTEAIGGAAAVADLPLISPYSASSTSPSTVSPPNSAAQPVLTWPATLVQAVQYPQSVLQSGPWSLDGSLETPQYDSFCREGLGIHLPNQLRQYTQDQHASAFGHLSYNHVDLNKPMEERFQDCVIQQRSYPEDYNENEDDDETDSTDPCYAKLLWTCLKEAPGHTLSLRELYDWVAQNSQKAKDPKTRGWQNSVRHNLSMNAAFERVPPCANQGAKKGSLWRLTDKALREGVISTTRYRKDPKHRPERRGRPAPKRQISGAKGGQATRAATRHRREMQHARSTPYLSLTDHHCYPRYRHHDGMQSPYSPHSAGHSPQLLMTPPSPSSPYHFSMAHEGVPAIPSYLATPPQIPLVFGEDVKPALSNFEFHPAYLANGQFFHNRDDTLPGTPSIETEASFMTDEGMPGLLSRDLSREATIF